MLGMLTGIGAATASGCSLWESDPPPPSPPPDPLEPLLASARDLAGRYARAIADHPELADRLGPLHEAHLAHETALREVIGRPQLTTPASPGTGTWVAPSTGASPPAGPQETVSALRRAERDGREQAEQACLAAEPGRAALLGSITAARRTHVEVLT